MAALAPTTATELAAIIADAAATEQRLEIRGGGSKAAIGMPGRAAAVLDMRGFAGVVDYDPPELVLTVRAGTPLADVRSLVARQGQMLAFEPFDFGPVLGAPAGASTIGGVVACGFAGSRRLSRGGVRDHVLGFAGVSGRGEAFVGGANVVKNVTGYDLPKLLTGSWGRLAALTEVTLKVLPQPPDSRTLVAHGLDAGQAWAVMARALGSQAEVSAAAHLPGGADGRSESATLLRLEGFAQSVAARAAMLEQVAAGGPGLATLSAADADALWTLVREPAWLREPAMPLWRLSLPARAFPALVARLDVRADAWLADWAGGLVWLRSQAEAASLRALVERAGGHAMRVCDPSSRAGIVPTFHPPAPALAALERRVRRAFDPAGVFATGRFGDDDAD